MRIAIYILMVWPMMMIGQGSNQVIVHQPCVDDDADLICNQFDNCISDANFDQADYDNDGIGDICDPDDDNDGTSDATDCDPMDATETAAVGSACNTDPCTTGQTVQAGCGCGGGTLRRVTSITSFWSNGVGAERLKDQMFTDDAVRYNVYYTGGTPTGYAWSIESPSTGTILSGQGTDEITATYTTHDIDYTGCDGVDGSVSLKVVVTFSGGCSDTEVICLEANGAA